MKVPWFSAEFSVHRQVMYDSPSWQSFHWPGWIFHYERANHEPLSFPIPTENRWSRNRAEVLHAAKDSFIQDPRRDSALLSRNILHAHICFRILDRASLYSNLTVSYGMTVCKKKTSNRDVPLTGFPQQNFAISRNVVAPILRCVQSDECRTDWTLVRGNASWFGIIIRSDESKCKGNVEGKPPEPPQC